MNVIINQHVFGLAVNKVCYSILLLNFNCAKPDINNFITIFSSKYIKEHGGYEGKSTYNR